MIEEIRLENPDDRIIQKAVQLLQKGGVVVLPTDTVYCFAVDMNNKKAIEKLARIKNVKLNKANFSIACADLSNLSDFTKPIDRPMYKTLRKALPGPFTFILTASNHVPKLFGTNKKTIGIRIPDNKITSFVIEALGNPIVVSSVNDDDDIVEYTTDPQEIHDRFENDVEMVIDGGYGKVVASTVVDCSNGYVEIIREGEGDVNLLD